MQNQIPRLLLSATGSDSGKTTMMLALLSAFQKSGVVVQSYKSGPDYIDPMFHEAVTHRPAYHTDPFFLQPDAMRKLVAATAQQADIALIEGAMGFYDGIGQTSEASAYTVSQWLETPAILVVNPQKMGRSVAAICKGFLQLEPHNRIDGFLLKKWIRYRKRLICWEKLPEKPLHWNGCKRWQKLHRRCRCRNCRPCHRIPSG